MSNGSIKYSNKNEHFQPNNAEVGVDDKQMPLPDRKSSIGDKKSSMLDRQLSIQDKQLSVQHRESSMQDRQSCIKDEESCVQDGEFRSQDKEYCAYSKEDSTCDNTLGTYDKELQACGNSLGTYNEKLAACENALGTYDKELEACDNPLGAHDKKLGACDKKSRTYNKELSLSILKKHWGYDAFRGIQEDIIQSICLGQDTLGLMPTGGGKSITFQVSSMMLEGTCLVITPLIALMKDQVEHLRDLGIKATAIYSGMSRGDVLRELDNCILGKFKFLYISPERLNSELFQTKLHHMTVNFITVDEAHCISQWGYDFRPSYLNISLVRKLKPDAPILALTATATHSVIKDIQQQLLFKKENVFSMSFERANLAYIVLPTNNKETTLLQTLQSEAGSAIIYTRNREQTLEIARLLSNNGITALHYHAGLENIDKDERQHLWQDDMIRVMVCTNAFGMGIDKSDVRLVVHIGVPDSIEAYFQEAGRAGRGGQPAKAILLKGPHDVAALKRHIDTAFPSKDFIREVYENICFHYELAVGDGEGLRKEFSINKFCKYYKYFPTAVLSALKILEHGGYLKYDEPEDSTSCAKIIVDKADMYRMHHLPKDCDTVLQALLRNYNGLFADLMPIEEILLAQRTKLSADEVYKNLRLLHLMGILYYIPFKHIAHITFLKRRVETSDLMLSRDVYEYRRMELVKRVHAMINYLTSQTTCRSRLLLEYFGQTDASDCGHCDNCQRNNLSRHSTNSMQAERAAQAVVALLADGKEHSYEEFKKLPMPISVVKQAMEQLYNEGEIEYNNGMIHLS